MPQEMILYSLCARNHTKQPLPNDYEFSHNYCLLLLRLISEKIISGEAVGIFNVSVPLQDNDYANVEGKPADQVLDWLEANNYEHHLKEMIFKQTFIAILSDFCDFISEALQSSFKGKLTVAYSLLRKPLKENLFVLEWLLADREGFIEAFNSIEKKNLDIDKIQPDKKIEIIRTALSKTRHGICVDPEFIHDLRYNKRIGYSFENVWQKAVHLTTKHDAIKTTPQNFNFVFSTPDALISQWEGIYTNLPLLLKHAYEVIEALVVSFSERENKINAAMVSLRVNIGYILWCKNGPIKNQKNTEFLERFEKELEELAEEASIICEKCSNHIDIRGKVHNIFYTLELKCLTCNHVTDLNF